MRVKDGVRRRGHPFTLFLKQCGLNIRQFIIRDLLLIQREREELDGGTHKPVPSGMTVSSQAIDNYLILIFLCGKNS